MQKKIKPSSIKSTIKNWGKILVLLVDDVAALLLVILVLRFFEIDIPLLSTIVIALLLGSLLFILHKAIIPSFYWQPISGREGMIGTHGRVVKPLTPLGVIIVKGEYWRAESVAENIGVDEKVEIVGLDGLTLRVKRKEH